MGYATDCMIDDFGVLAAGRDGYDRGVLDAVKEIKKWALKCRMIHVLRAYPEKVDTQDLDRLIRWMERLEV